METINIMRLLILDQVFPIGHKSLNSKFVALLSERYDLIILNHKNFYDQELFKNVVFLNIKLIAFPWKNSFFNILSSFFNSIIIGTKSLFIKYDKVLLLTFDTIGYVFLSFFMHKSVYLFHHNNTDHLKNKYLYLFFRIYKNNVRHIVFADFIKEALMKYNLDEKNIYILPHPLTDSIPQINYTKSNMQDIKYYIGLGYATDEKIIGDIINFENKTGILKNNNICIILRSSNIVYESLNIKVINKHLDKSEYENYFSLANAILLLYPINYENRFSGVILDAFRYSKKVIGTNIPIINYFAQLYPNSCIPFETIEDLFISLVNLDDSFSDDDFNLFIENHLDCKIEEKLFEIVNG
jgi:hypothetical protein